MPDSTQTAIETLGAAVTDLVNAVGGALDAFDTHAIKRSESTPDGLAILGATREAQQDLISNEGLALALLKSTASLMKIGTAIITDR